MAKHREFLAKRKFFHVVKRYGFITTAKGDDLFVHGGEIRGRDPHIGDWVKYSVGTDAATGRCQAINVQVVGNDR
jgi:cold shock CspA family protein